MLCFDGAKILLFAHTGKFFDVKQHSKTQIFDLRQDAGRRLLDAPCKGIVSPYAESAYNIDNYETLLQARRCMPPEAACSA